MNHIATGRALSPGGELLPPHHGSQQRRWRWRWSRWRWLRGQFPVPAECQNRDFCPPNLVCDGGGATELFVDFCLGFLGFSTRRHLIGEEATRGGARGAHTTPGRGLAWPAPGLHENGLFWSIRTRIEPNFRSRIISIKFPTLLRKTCFPFDVVFEGQTDNL